MRVEHYRRVCLESPHCPRCQYPCNGPRGQPYLGIYTPGERCDYCGYKDTHVQLTERRWLKLEPIPAVYVRRRAS